MMDAKLLEILRCPACAQDERLEGVLEQKRQYLVCADCGRKYPIRDEIPVLLIREGDRWKDTNINDLEAPPSSAK